MKSVKINFVIEPQMAENLKRIQEKFGLGKSEIIRRGIISEISKLTKLERIADKK